MRSQAIGVSQFPETFEASAVQVVKDGASEDHFATVLHQATGDRAVAEDSAFPSTSDNKLLVGITSEETATTTASITNRIHMAQGELDIQSHPKQLQPTAIRKSSLIPVVSLRAIDEQKEVEVQSTDVSFAALKENAAPTGDVQPTSVDHLRADVSATPLPVSAMAVPAQTQIDQVASSARGERSMKSAIAWKVDSTKGVRPGTDIQEAPPSLNIHATVGVTNGNAANSPTYKENNASLLQVVALQSQVVTLDAAKAAATHGVTIPSGQSSGVKREESSAERKIGVKTGDEVAPESDAQSAIRAATEPDGSGLSKDIDSEAANVSVPVDAAIGSLMHGVLASGVTLGDSLLASAHPSENRAASAILMVGGPGSEVTNSLTSTQFRTTAAPGTVLPHAMLSSSATSLEVGVASGTHGWLKIRAELTGGGEVNASLTGGSSIAANRLRSDLPALSSYLQAEKVQVNGLDVHAALLGPTSASINSDRSTYDGSDGLAASSDGGAAGGRPQQQDGQGASSVPAPIGSNDGPEVLLDRMSDLVVFGDGMGLGGNGSLSSVEYGTGGGWLNVRA